jgi:hypothetical protein
MALPGSPARRCAIVGRLACLIANNEAVTEGSDR